MAEPIEPPARSRRHEVTEIVASAVLGPIPIVGPAVQELVGKWIVAPYEQRLQEFFVDVATRLNDLTAGLDDVRREAILGRPELVSVITMAIRAAEHTHQQEKLEHLRNAVLNVAVGVDDLDYDTTASLMRRVDELTPTHVRVLRILARPADAAEALPADADPGSLAEIVDLLIPGLHATTQDRETEFQRISRDLANAGLIIDGLSHQQFKGLIHKQVEGHGKKMLYGNGVGTPFGERFLRLIEEPKRPS